MSQFELPHDHGKEIVRIWDKLPAPDAFQGISELMRQLGDCSRLQLFFLLCHCEECVINLSAMMNMSSPAVSHHLKQLRTSGLIVSHRKGKEVYYKAADNEISRVLHQLTEQLMVITCPLPAASEDSTAEEGKA